MRAADALIKPVEMAGVPIAGTPLPGDMLKTSLVEVADKTPHICLKLEGFDEASLQNLGWKVEEAMKKIITGDTLAKRWEMWGKVGRRWLLGEGTRLIVEGEYAKLKQMEEPPYFQAEAKAMYINNRINSVRETETTPRQFIGQADNHADIGDPLERRALYLSNYLKVLLRDPKIDSCRMDKLEMTREFFHPDKLRAYGVSKQDLFDLQNQMYLLADRVSQAFGSGRTYRHSMENFDVTEAALSINPEDDRSRGLYGTPTNINTGFTAISFETHDLNGNHASSLIQTDAFRHPNRVFDDGYNKREGYYLYADPADSPDMRMRAENYTAYADARMKTFEPFVRAVKFSEGVRAQGETLVSVESDPPELPGRWDISSKDAAEVQVVEDDRFRPLKTKAEARAGEITRINTEIAALTAELDALEMAVEEYRTVQGENRGIMGNLGKGNDLKKIKERIIAVVDKKDSPLAFEWDDKKLGELGTQVNNLRFSRCTQYRQQVENMAIERAKKGEELAADYVGSHTKPPFMEQHPEIPVDSFEVTVVSYEPARSYTRQRKTKPPEEVSVKLSEEDFGNAPGDKVTAVVRDYVATAAALGNIESTAVNKLGEALYRLTKLKPESPDAYPKPNSIGESIQKYRQAVGTDQNTAAFKKRFAQVAAGRARYDLANQVGLGVNVNGMEAFAGGVYKEPLMAAWQIQRTEMITAFHLPLAV